MGLRTSAAALHMATNFGFQNHNTVNFRIVTAEKYSVTRNLLIYLSEREAHHTKPRAWRGRRGVAALSLGSFRKIILNWKMIFALAIGIALIFPHLIWAFQNFESISGTAHKFKIQSDALSGKMIFGGLKNLVSASVTHVGILVGT